MRKAIAHSLIAIFVVFAVGNPTANAVPMTSYHQQRIYIQQGSVLNDITEALGVSEHRISVAMYILHWNNHSAAKFFFFYLYRMR